MFRGSSQLKAGLDVEAKVLGVAIDRKGAAAARLAQFLSAGRNIVMIYHSRDCEMEVGGVVSCYL